MHIRPKNWGDFQHYKDRSPTWIKLHKGLLDDYEFQSLPLASRALAPMLWLLASEEKDGTIDANDKKLAFRLRMTATEIEDAIKPLIEAGFFIVVGADSGSLAEPEHAASPEKKEESREQVEKQEQKNAPAALATFGEFWNAFPKKVDELRAQEAYARAVEIVDPAVILAGARRYSVTVRREKPEDQFIKTPRKWLEDRRWTDGASTDTATLSPFNSPEEQAAQRALMEKHYGQA